jgi:hypothetical protein
VPFLVTLFLCRIRLGILGIFEKSVLNREGGGYARVVVGLKSNFQPDIFGKPDVKL